MHVLSFSSFGEPGVLSYHPMPDPVPSEGEILLDMKAIGLNYADIYRRKGNYHLKGNPPYIAGYEGSGVVAESRSEKFQPGQRVAFADVPFANATKVVVPETHAIPLPDDIDHQAAASLLLQGLTAQYLAQDSFAVQPGHTAVIHAAGGGVGQLLTQICKLKGARVIGLSRSATKLELIRQCGADEALQLDSSWEDRVLELTGSKGADVVYDSVGSTLQASFRITREKGTVVFYGMSGGDPAPVDPRMLMDSSKTLTGGDLWSYLISAEERHKRSAQLFDWYRRKQILIQEPVCFPLAEGARAHHFLESGQSASKILLIP